MVTANNIKTGVPARFTDEQWEQAKASGFAKKFKDVAVFDDKPSSYIPPEVEFKKAAEIKLNKPVKPANKRVKSNTQ